MAVLFRGKDRWLALFFGAPKPNLSAVTFRERRMKPELSTTIIGVSWFDSFPSEGAETSPVRISWRCSLPTLTSGPVRSRGAGPGSDQGLTGAVILSSQAPDQEIPQAPKGSTLTHT
jgi:hypothetical protein